MLFLPGCDFRCPYCHNAELVRAPLKPCPSTLDDFYAHLDRRKTLISGVVISGGEPLVHEDAARIARAVRELGLAVKLDTNGSFPSRIADIYADYVALDLKTAPAAYRRVAPGFAEAGNRVMESLAYLRSSGTEFEIRITCAPGIVGDEEFREIALSLEKDDEVYLQDFRPGGCLDPAWDKVEPYPHEAMAEYLAILRRRAPRTRIRGA